MASQIPGWLPMSISAVPLPPDGPLPGLDVQVRLKIPANSDVQLHLPVVVGPVGYQSPVRVRCRFDAAGKLSHLSYDNPFTDHNDDSTTMESDGDDNDSIKMESDGDNNDAAMLPLHGTFKLFNIIAVLILCL